MKSEKTKKTIPFIPIATSLIGLSLCPLIAQATTATIQPPQEASTTNSRAIATFDLSEWTYTETTNSITLTKYNGTNAAIYVPGDYHGKQIILTNFSIFPSSMTHLQLEEVNGKKVGLKTTSLVKAFYNNKTVISLDLNGLDTSSVVTTNSMFSGTTNLASLHVSDWDTSNVTNMASMFANAKSLTTLDLNGWDTSKVTTMQDMFKTTSKLESLHVSNWNTSKVTSMKNMFYSASNLTLLDVSKWDTSNVTDMSYMFQSAKKLESLDLSDWDTSKVTDMRSMFQYTNNLTSLNVQGWDTSNVTNMQDMFYGASSLTSLNLKNWNTSKVTRMDYMFREVSSLTSLDLSGWDTSNVTNMGYMFSRASSLKTLNVQGWDTSKVTKMTAMFSEMSKLTSLDLSGWNTANVTDMSRMFYKATSLNSLKLSGWNTSKVTNMTYMFYYAYSIESLDVSNWDTSNVTDMSYMFCEATDLTKLDVSNWDTSNVTNMESMFYSTFKLSELDVSGWNTSKVTNMSNMFTDSHTLTTLNVSNWDTSNVTNMFNMFSGVSKVTTLDVSNWDTSNVTNMGHLFWGLSSLTTLDVSNWDTSNVTNMSYMFGYLSEHIETLDIANWDTSSMTDLRNMFYGAKALTTLDLSNWDTSNLINISEMFKNAGNLTSLNLSGWDVSNVTLISEMFSGANKLTVIDLSGWELPEKTTLQRVFKTSTQTPLLIITQDEKLKTYNFQSDNRTGTQLTFQANGGQFPDGTTEFSSPEIFTIDSREEEVIQAFIESVGNSKGIPIRKDYQFSGWTTDVIETTNELEMILNRLSATYKAQWKGDSSSDLYSNPFFDDFCGQDFKAPDMPVIKEHGYTEDGFIWLAFDPVEDHGSTYSYYVQATHLNGTGVAFSNIASATVTTGVKGYSWVADSNPDTIPDDIVEQTDHRQINIPTNNSGPYYLHIKALDHAGNASETFHYELTDTTKPTFTLTQNPTDWTNQDVIITIEASDDGTIPSGVKEIILPDGNKVSGDNATFTAIENGTYTFEVIDFMGNSQIESITISNIDKVAPTGSIIIDQDQDELYDEETELHINMSDILDGQEKLSGIAKVEIFDVNGSYSYTMTNPTDYQQTIPWVLVPYELSDGSLKAQVGMTLTDKAGNTTTVYSKEVTIIKVRIDEFYLTDVVHPGIYNSNNPFTRLTYPNIPSQELLIGGSFEFDAIYSYPPTANEMWTADYEANIHYVHPTDGTRVIPITLTRQPVNGSFTARHTIPMDVKVGTEVYLELSVKVYNGGQKLMGQDSFPDPEGTLLKIGEITGDIREFIRFNEVY